MRYMCLIYASENHPDGQSPDLMPAYMAFTQEVSEKKVMLAGDPLQPIGTATTVRVRNGKTATTDGPFAETKEALGGCYILDCKDLDEAIAYAAKIPSAKFGSIEVRPIMEM
jgi:hypothetical protein